MLVSPLLYLVLLNLEDVAELAEGEWRVGPELELRPVVGRRLLQRTVPETITRSKQSYVNASVASNLSMHLLQAICQCTRSNQSSVIASAASISQCTRCKQSPFNASAVSISQWHALCNHLAKHLLLSMHPMQAIRQCICCKQCVNARAVSISQCTCCKQSSLNAPAASNLSGNTHALSNNLSMHLLQAICQCTCYKQSANEHAVRRKQSSFNAPAASNLSGNTHTISNNLSMHLLQAICQCTCYKQSANVHAVSNHLSMYLLQAIFQCTCCKLSSNTHALRNHLSMHLLKAIIQCISSRQSVNAFALSNQPIHTLKAIICQCTCCESQLMHPMQATINLHAASNQKQLVNLPAARN